MATIEVMSIVARKKNIIYCIKKKLTRSDPAVVNY